MLPDVALIKRRRSAVGLCLRPGTARGWWQGKAAGVATARFEFARIDALILPSASERIGRGKDLESTARQYREVLRRKLSARSRAILRQNRERLVGLTNRRGWRVSFGRALERRLIRQVPLPKSVAWTTIARNYHVDDEPVLRYVPYFGDDDVTGVDVSAYEGLPAEGKPHRLSEEDELTALFCSQISGDDQASALATALTANGSSLSNTEALQDLARSFLADGKGTGQLEPTKLDAYGLRQRPAAYADLSESYRDLFCRRCYVYDCAEHGARQPLPRARRDPSARVEHLLFDDYMSLNVLEQSANATHNEPLRRKIIAVLDSWRHTSSSPAADEKSRERKAASPRPASINLFRRQRLALTCPSKKDTIAALPRAYVACDHDGDCESAERCPCAAKRPGGFCEKYCACPPWCRARFPGCRCKASGPKKVGCRASSCECVASGRECDSDLCGCVCCVNQPLANNRHKRIALGRSSTHGWGAFALEPAKAGDFVGEYKGELVSHDEADRRGKIYDKLNCSFLFNLDDDNVVDATRHGSKMKFANHNAKDPNLVARVTLVRGDHRIGLYAKRDIFPGDELNFNYSTSFWDAAQQEFTTAKATVL